VSTAREAILERVRSALGDTDASSPGREAGTGQAAKQPPSSPRPEADAAALMELFVQRVSDYGATVRATSRLEIAEGVASICAEHGVERLACPADLPRHWLPATVEAVADDPALSHAELDQVGGVLTGCALAAAETGTLALDHGARQGRRALTLLPDLQICVVEASQLVPDIADLISRLADTVAGRRPLTLISGPSATSDIELERVEGVHGPRRLALLLIPPDPAGSEQSIAGEGTTE
jgi:L-lactate dehydrogenase complex protein LldG